MSSISPHQLTKTIKITQMAWLIFCVFTTAFFLSTYIDLPARFATHFDLNGQPNGWSTKPFYLGLFGSLLVVTNALLLALIYFRESVRFNIYRIYEREKFGTDAEIRAEVLPRASLILSLTGVFINLIFIACIQMIAQAAIPMPLQLSPNAIIIIVFALAALLTVLSLKISRPPKRRK